MSVNNSKKLFFFSDKKEPRTFFAGNFSGLCESKDLLSNLIFFTSEKEDGQSTSSLRDNVGDTIGIKEKRVRYIKKHRYSLVKGVLRHFPPCYVDVPDPFFLRLGISLKNTEKNMQQCPVCKSLRTKRTQSPKEFTKEEDFRKGVYYYIYCRSCEIMSKVEVSYFVKDLETNHFRALVEQYFDKIFCKDSDAKIVKKELDQLEKNMLSELELYKGKSTFDATHKFILSTLTELNGIKMHFMNWVQKTAKNKVGFEGDL